MERISNATKCVNCCSVLNSPVLLPCGHSICKHHTNGQNQIKCEKCGRDHMIPKEGLPDNEALAEVIASQVHEINLGEAHIKARKDYESFELLVKRVELVLTDPSFETCEEIDGMKNEVFLKREELKLKIDQETDKLINKLDCYLEKFKAQLNSEQSKKKSNDLTDKKKSATVKLNDFKSRFNLVILDEMWWQNTTSEIANELRELSENLENFNRSLVIQSDLDELKSEVELFKKSPEFKIETKNLPINKNNSNLIFQNQLDQEINTNILDKMIGEWELIWSKNFEELMKAQGIDSLTRFIFAACKPNVRIEKQCEEWTFTTTFSAVKPTFLKFKLNQEFDEQTIDRRIVRTKITLKGHKLVHTQRDLNKNNVVCIITHEITPTGELKTTTAIGDVVSTCIFQRIIKFK